MSLTRLILSAIKVDLVKRQNLALILLRIYLAAMMIIHGVTRITVGGVEPFGEFLTISGFPFGFYLAWAISIFEIGGGIILVSGYFAYVLSLIFVAELIMGIILVHAKEGWFVVGLGRNGMEYSVLLIVSFLIIAFSSFGKSKE